MSDIKFATKDELIKALQFGTLVRTLGDHTSIYRYEGHDYFVSSSVVPELPAAIQVGDHDPEPVHPLDGVSVEECFARGENPMSRPPHGPSTYPAGDA